MVLNELTEQIGDNDYYLCMNEECDITYKNKIARSPRPFLGRGWMQKV